MTDERTNEQISAAIAERLFNWEQCHKGCLCVPPTYYASDHNAALGLVVPEMRQRGWAFFMADEPAGIQVLFESRADDETYWLARAPFGEEPRAICLAVLAALDAERKAE